MVRFERRRKESNQPEPLNQQSLPTSGLTSPRPQRCPQKPEALISKRLNNLHYLQKMRMLKNVMHNLYGRHYPIDYHPDFNFQESWQNTTKNTPDDDKYSVLKTQNFLYLSFHSLLCASFGFMVWFFSVYRIFQINTAFHVFLGIVLLLQVVDVIRQHCLILDISQQKIGQENSLTLRQYFVLHHKALVSSLYIIFLLVQELAIKGGKMKWLFAVDLVFVWMSYRRFQELYSAVKIRILASKYRNESMIMQLFGGCILLVHIFGVLLYLVSLADPNVNWTKSIENFGVSWFSRYVHSLYFACTTALTVGYGDILPKNLFEIITILCVQIVGLINTGYVVNEIGRILSKMNENQEQLHKSISEAQQLKKNYHLPLSISSKMKTYIINNQKASNQLNVEEQDSFMRKLNDQIREQVISHHQLQVVKSSVFFLCHWSKKFQRKIATKLTRCIYSPQQTLSQVHGKEKMYLLTKGKMDVQVFNPKNTSSSSLIKCVRSIEVDSTKDVQFNVFGYSALISGLIINLKGIFKDYSICYKVDKEDIMKIIVEDKNDFEYFHEIKGRIEQNRFKEIFEAPGISNTREHYLPNPYFIIKKDRMKLKKKNKRKSNYIRSNHQIKLHFSQNREKSEHEIESEGEVEWKQKNVTFASNPVENNSILTKEERDLKYKSMEQGKGGQVFITNRKYRRKNLKKPTSMSSIEEEKVEKDSQLLNFEEVKIYKTYFRKFNFDKVNQRYIEHSKGSCPFKKSSLSKAFESLGPQFFDKLKSFKKIGSIGTASQHSINSLEKPF